MSQRELYYRLKLFQGLLFPWFSVHRNQCRAQICISIEAFLHPVVSWSSLILGVCIRSVCWFLCCQKLMPAHLVVLRPGLRWQTTGDEEDSALQFRTVPTELLRLTKQVCVCVCAMYFAGVHCLYACRLVELFAAARARVYIYLMRGTCRHKKSESHVGKCMWMLSVYIRAWDSDAMADICLHPE